MLFQNYQNPTQSNKSAFAYATGTEFWNHLQKSPMNSRIFNDYMATRRRGRQSWFDIYPVDRELSSALPNSDSNLQQESSILLVDVGGNRGHDLIALKANYPNLAGKMILQDLPEVIANAEVNSEDDNRIEAMAHDFFEPQPIRRIDSPSQILTFRLSCRKKY